MARTERSRFDWDEHNIGHVAKHDVKPIEVEQGFANNPLFIETRIDPNSGEERILELGHTNTDRVLFVVWTPRGRLIRVVTAFPANRKTRVAYNKKRENQE